MPTWQGVLTHATLCPARPPNPPPRVLTEHEERERESREYLSYGAGGGWTND